MLTQSIATVLAGKEIRDVLTTPPSATVAEAAALMSSKDVGAVVVRGASKVEGIFTERDLLRRVVTEGRDPKATKISAVMSPNVRTVSSETEIQDALRLMVEHRYRHLLVQDGENLLGIISIRDLMFAQIRPDQAPPHEGRPGVLRARTEEALRAVQPLDRAGPT